MKDEQMILDRDTAYKKKESLFPEFLNVETINQCNLNCVMCPIDKMTRARGTMSMELYEKIIEECRNYTHIIKNFSLFMQGEPLLDNLLERRIKIAKEAGIPNIQIATNGTLLTPSRAKKLIDSGLDSIIISLEGISKNVHEKVRVGSKYEKIITNLETLISIRNDLGLAKPEITVRMLAFKENEPQREIFIDHWKTKVEEVIINPLHNWGGAEPFGRKVSYANFKCDYLWKSMVILIDGRVPLCCLDYDGVYTLGNVYDESIYNIWHGEKYKLYRKKYKNNQIELCTHCNWIPGSIITHIRKGRVIYDKYKNSKKKMLEWTGERYLPFVDPKISGAEIHYEHLHRYYFALHFVKDKKVLDLACGEGYGSYILSKSAEYIVGIDIDKKTVKHASSKYIRNNLEFIQGSILKIPIASEKLFDVLVCFEALEHVKEHEELMKEVKRLLKDDGIFIVSTPNKKAYSDDINYKNPFHEKELYFDEFKELLKSNFNYVYFFGQKVYAGSHLWSLTRINEIGEEYVIERRNKGFAVTDYEKKEPMYFIAITSDKEIDISKHALRSYLTDVDNTVFDNFRRYIQRLEEEVREIAMENLRINTELNSIKSSVTWRTVMKWYSFIDKIMPQGTRRRRWYELGIIGLRTIVNEGWKSFWWKYKQHRATKKLEVYQEKERLSNENHLEDWTGEKIVFPKPQKNPDVSIVIPVHNNAKYTFNCLKSILKNTKGSFEAIVVDDASGDETSDLLKNVENIRVLRNEKNQGFVESCNRGAKASNGNYLFFLNNDTIVAENWLEPLIETIEKEKVGAVGVKLVYPDGRLQEAGGIIWNDASGWNYGRYDEPDKPEYNFVREVDYCSGAALLVRRDLFEKFGGFNEMFKPGYYEDTDLCFSIRKEGYKVLYQPKCVVIHFEGITGGTDITSGVKKYQEINKEKFFKKWFDILEKEHYEPDSTNLFLARDRRKGKNVLVIDHYVPTFDKDSGSYRMYNLLKILTELGHKVTFIGDNFERFEPYTSTLQQLGVEVVYAPYIKSVEEYIAKNGKFFDIVILSRAHIAISHISSVKKYCDKANIVFDTVDLQFLRESRRAKIENNEILLKEAEKLKKLEFQIAKISDITLVVSPVEKAMMLKEDPCLRIEIIPNIHEIKQPEKTFSDRRDIMFLGGFAHLPNVDAVKWFVNEIYPLIKEKIPDVKFYVVGSEPPKEIKSLGSGDIIVTGYVKDLTPYFESCRVFVSPLRYGAGVKGKINHSMSFGLPVVTTSIGAEGIGLVDGVDALIADEPEEFAEKVVKLYENEEMWNKLSKNSIENIRKNYSPEVIKERLKNIFDNLDKDAEASDILLKMRKDWDKRAKKNFKHYISYSKTENEFEESGRINVDDFVAKNLELITDGRDPKNMCVLEIGCGAGRMTRYLGKIFGEVHGVDVSDEMIRLGKTRLKLQSNVHLHRNNGSDLSIFPDNLFDFVFSYITFQHIPEKEIIINYIKEANKVLKPNRIFKFQVHGYVGKEYLKVKKDTWLGVSFSENEMREIAKSLNFEIIEMKGQGTQYFWVTLKKRAYSKRRLKSPNPPLIKKEEELCH